MKVGRWKSSLAATMATMLLATMTAYPLTAMAQSAKGIMMYEDTKTGAFYSKPGKNRIAVLRDIQRGVGLARLSIKQGR